ncbi:MAG: sulfite exporter TauE/SafE family protein [Beijerinckiaceae bacterium]
MTEALVIFAGALLGGFVSGLAGFGTALTAIGIWLHVAPPAVVAPLIVCCSCVAQSQTLPRIWKSINWRRIWPMIAAGIVGVPIGAWLLTLAEPRLFRLGIGILLVVFCSAMLLLRARPTTQWGGKAADAAIGFGGGIMGGLAGLSGPLPTIWASLRGWPKDERRGLFQAYNTTMLLWTLVAFVARGLVTAEVGRMFLVALPGTLIGAWLGMLVYRRLSDSRFHDVALLILVFSGASLIWPFLFGK